MEIVGVAWRGGDRIGKSMYDYLDVEKGDREDVIIGTHEDVIKEGVADLVIISTDSFTKDNFVKIKYCLEKKNKCYLYC